MSGRRLHLRRGSLVAVLGIAAALLGLGGASAFAAIPAPAWSVRSLAVPTNFTPGDGTGSYAYEVRARNKGGAATDGSPIVLTDTLPVGLTVDSVQLVLRAENPSGEFDFGPNLCETEKPGAAEIVRCTIPEELAEASDPTLVEASEVILAVIHVSPLAVAPGDLVNLAEVAGGGAPTASATSHNPADPEPAGPGVSAFEATLTGVDGAAATGAASHPYQLTTSFAVNTRARSGSSLFFDPAGGDIKDVRVELPPGLIGNPTATSRCTAQEFNSTHHIEPQGVVVTQNDCPDGSVVGLVVVQQLEGRGTTLPVPLYNLVPPKGMPAQFGFQVLNAPFYIDTAVRAGGDYGITAELRNTTEVQRVTAADVTVWGVPSESIHDPQRGSCLSSTIASRLPFSLGTCPAGLTAEPFLRLPTSCEAPLLAQTSFDIWTDPGVFLKATYSEPPPLNCASLDFSPTIVSRPHTTVADSPSGLRFNLHLPQSSDPDLLAEADLRDAVVTLPEGVAVNPASANGLEGCSPAQVGLNDPGPARCPNASKIGTVEIHTPLLDHLVTGGVYVATQNDNPFDSLLAIYIAVDDPQSGVVVKLAGHVTPDPDTGRLTTRFEDNPQLPFEDLTVEFFDGPRAPLRTPGTCGDYSTTTGLKPWSAPDSGPDATPSDTFAVSTAPGGGACAATEAAQPHRPSFAAGATAPIAGAYSPFLTRLGREDGAQALRSLKVSLPPGLLGKLAGVPYCPEAAIAAASLRSGAQEQVSPSCPAASQVGVVNVGAGAGSSPVYVRGRVYLAGPYNGAPLSLAVITPAVAGPFDLGAVVVRAALEIDPRTAQVTVDSDPLPTILQGIPLDVRRVAVDIDRHDFTLNPTNCEPMSVGGEAISVANASAALADRFQVGGCRGLGFAPKLSLRLLGGTRRNAHPALRAVLVERAGDANIARAAVALPHSVFLSQDHIDTVCTRVQFAAGDCPPGSIYGYARAVSPLLDAPLRGPVYLRASSNPLPDLVAALHGQVDIELDGRIDSVHGGIRTTFDAAPDAPVTRFVLEMKGGKKGLLVNSRNLCEHPSRAVVKMNGQNGRVHDFRPPMKTRC